MLFYFCQLSVFMHRLVAFLLICLYLPAALNATVTAHYCMGKLTGVDVMSSAPVSNKCGKCSMLKKDRKGCCQDKQETLKLNKDQLYSFVPVLAMPFVAVVQSPSFLQNNIFFAARINNSSKAHSPPLIAVSPLLLYCVFRI